MKKTYLLNYSVHYLFFCPCTFLDVHDVSPMRQGWHWAGAQKFLMLMTNSEGVKVLHAIRCCPATHLGKEVESGVVETFLPERA